MEKDEQGREPHITKREKCRKLGLGFPGLLGFTKKPGLEGVELFSVF